PEEMSDHDGWGRPAGEQAGTSKKADLPVIQEDKKEDEKEDDDVDDEECEDEPRTSSGDSSVEPGGRYGEQGTHAEKEGGGDGEDQEDQEDEEGGKQIGRVAQRGEGRKRVGEEGEVSKAAPGPAERQKGVPQSQARVSGAAEVVDVMGSDGDAPATVEGSQKAKGKRKAEVQDEVQEQETGKRKREVRVAMVKAMEKMESKPKPKPKPKEKVKKGKGKIDPPIPIASDPPNVDNGQTNVEQLVNGDEQGQEIGGPENNGPEVDDGEASTESGGLGGRVTETGEVEDASVDITGEEASEPGNVGEGATSEETSGPGNDKHTSGEETAEPEPEGGAK
ncbi:hypothetical protein FRC06_010910, partial [Ceratobasidium sp. 370]